MVAPLVADDVDLRDFPFMPLDVVKLRDSDIAAIASGDEFRAAVMLWCAAWHQVPAASLPDDDRMLARLAGYGRDIDGWLAVKSEALRNFVRCDDGRLYHPLIAEKAVDSWEKKQRFQERLAAAREAKKRKAAEQASITDSIIESAIEFIEDDTIEPATGHKGEREGKGTGDRGQGIGEKENNKNKPHKARPFEILRECLSEATARDVVEHRRKKRSPLTDRAAQELVREMVAFGDPERAAAEMISRGWAGFKSEWMANQSRAGPQQNRSSAFQTSKPAANF